MVREQGYGVPTDTVREIKMEKNNQFTTKFINEFCGEWERATKRLKGCGRSLDAIPIVRK